MSFVGFQSKADLIRFLASSEVVRVYRNELRQHSLTQSLPLISQPSVATAGSIGSGTTVAVLDSGVDYTRSAFGFCTSPTQPSGCKVIYAQDFAPNDNQLDDDGHGKTDILWQQSTTGYLSMWFMEGATLTSSTYLNPNQVAPGWKAVGTGDFNNDGKIDILWQSNTDYLSVWFMNGPNLISGSQLNPNQVATGWKPVISCHNNRL